MRPLQDLRRQNTDLRSEFEAGFSRFLDSGRYVAGPAVEEFERAFAEYCGARFCVAVSTGTAAIEIACRALGIGSTSKVLVPGMTFVATPQAVLTTGASVTLCDVDFESRLMDPDFVETLLANGVNAVLPVHLHGRQVDLTSLVERAKAEGVSIVEDASQAAGSFLNGAHAGVTGDVGTFSFYPGKNLGALGEGGCLITDREDVAEFARLYRNWGAKHRYEHDFDGSNHRMHELQACFLRVKLQRLDSYVEARRQAALQYTERLSASSVGIPIPTPDHAFHVYAVTVRKRETAQRMLADAGYETGVHYPRGIHQNRPYSKLGLVGELANTERLANELLSLPMDEYLTETEVDEICEVLKRSQL